MFTFEKAERKKSKLRLGISAPSGGGKTYSALLIAYGITKDWSKIAVIDTERGSAELYSNLGGYCVGQLEAPFTPQKYIEAIHSAEQAGFDVIIIDSLSHAWSGEGGMLEMQDAIAKASKSGSSFNAWREITPLHNKLVNTILQSSCHIIITTRSKTEYVLQDNGNGRQAPKKVGLAPVFRDGLEYEMTTFFDLSVDHIATVTKDRTNLFDGQYFTIDISVGEKFADWLNSGAIEPPVICPDCKKEILAVPLKNGTTMQAKQFLKTYGCCAECARKKDAEKKQREAEEKAKREAEKIVEKVEEKPSETGVKNNEKSDAKIGEC